MRSVQKRRPPTLEFDSRGRVRGRRGRGPNLFGRRVASLALASKRGAPASGDWVPHARSVTSAQTEIVHLQQYYRGLRVYRSAVVLKRRGKRRRTSSGGASIPPSTTTDPRVTASQALPVAVAFLQQRRAVPHSLRARVVGQSRFALRSMPTVLTCRRGFSEPVRAHLEVFPIPHRRARLAWVFEIAPEARMRCEVVVSADTRRPAVLFCHRTTSCVGFQASWTRFPRDLTGSRGFPLETIAAPIGRPTPAASTWLDALGTASGPNLSCHIGTREFPHSLMGPSIENAFVWCNLLHDFFAAFGFDSSLGAFDSGEDPLQVRVFESKSERAGFFDNNVDGFSPQMMLFATRSSAGVHAALDPSILIHEYTHGVSNRLLGGTELASPFAGDEAQALNEGYSDYFALTLLSFLDRANGGNRELRQIGMAFKPANGVRDYGNFNGVLSPSLKDVYDVAMVWCAGLLDARTSLTNRVGMTADHADRFLWQALVDSLRGMAPTCPRHNCLTLAHAKDALLTASREMETRLPVARGATEAVKGALSGRSIP